MCIRYQCQRIQRLKNFGALCPWLDQAKAEKVLSFCLSCFNVLQLIECMCFRHIKKYFNLGDLVLSSVIGWHSTEINVEFKRRLTRT